MFSPWIALAYLGTQMWRGYDRLRGRQSAPAEIRLQPSAALEEGHFAAACAELRELGFTTIGDFEVRLQSTRSTHQRSVLRAFLAPDATAFAVVYELVSLTVVPGAQAGVQKVWAEFVSRRSEDESHTTSNGDLPMLVHDENPARTVLRLPGLSMRELWERHRAAVGSSLSELDAGQFVELFERAWRRGFEFQASRGLYRRVGDRFVATGKLALRGVVGFHLQPRVSFYPLRIAAAVAAGSALTWAVAGREPASIATAAGAIGAAFAATFRHFELPAAAMIFGMGIVLGRDEAWAIVPFLLVLAVGAIVLQRARAARAAERLR
jgi:hypothetical protein